MPIEPITVLLHGGRVLRADGTFGEAIAISDGTVVAIGADADLAGLPARETVDLGGRLVVPGFVDAHAHPVQGGLEMARCDLAACETVSAVERTVRAYVSVHPDLEWIVGGGWSISSFPDGRPASALLDTVVASRPAYFVSRDHHSA